MLRKWAEAKYSLPWTHESLQQLTLLELLVMFWEDYYRKNPVETRRAADGRVIYSNTGDALIDKWEQELAMGLEPDLLEGVAPEERKKEAEASKRLQRQQSAVGAEGVGDGFAEEYDLERTGIPFIGRG